MKALLCTEFGSLEKLSVQDVPSPRPGANQVVIDVKASSLNFPDTLMVKGLYQTKPPLPFSPGSELAGVVKEIGEGYVNSRSVIESSDFAATAASPRSAWPRPID